MKQSRTLRLILPLAAAVGCSGGGSTTGTGNPPATTTLCTDSCPYAGDGECDDGGPGAAYAVCELGTDCADCGPRTVQTSTDSPATGTGGGSSSTLDWYTSPCSDLGGTETPLGACVIPCTTDADCTIAPATNCYDPPESGYDNPFGNCGLPWDSATSDADCGPRGWVLWGDGRFCALACTTEGYPTAECPTGYGCRDHTSVGERVQCGKWYTGGAAACSDCLSTCRGLPSCCQGVGCICEAECS